MIPALLLVEDISLQLPCVDGHGVLLTMLVSPVDRPGVVSATLMSIELIPVSAGVQGVVVSTSLHVENGSVSYEDRQGVLVFSTDDNEVVSLTLTTTELISVEASLPAEVILVSSTTSNEVVTVDTLGVISITVSKPVPV